MRAGGSFQGLLRSRFRSRLTRRSETRTSRGKIQRSLRRIRRTILLRSYDENLARLSAVFTETSGYAS
jgi:hypothetical protein